MAGTASRAPEQDDLVRLASWRPAGGVLSLYVTIDPADRRQGWRIELRDRLDVVESAEPDRQPALQSSSRRARR